MMRFYIFVVLLLGAIGVQGQSKFFEEGKYWKYRVYAPSVPEKGEAFFKIYVDGDTIINDTLAVRLTSTRIAPKAEHFYAYEDNGRIYGYTQVLEQFVPIVDFNASVGDTLAVKSVDMYLEGRCKVIEKQTVEVEGESRSVITIKDLDGISDLNGYWIEGLGAIDDFYWLTRYPETACIFVKEMVECGVGDKCIYTKENFMVYAGIGVATAASGIDATVYDLAGRPVLSPRKGCVYIRGGKKILW